MLNDPESDLADRPRRHKSSSPAIREICDGNPSFGWVPVISPRIEREPVRLGHPPTTADTFQHFDIVLNCAPHLGFALVLLEKIAKIRNVRSLAVALLHGVIPPRKFIVRGSNDGHHVSGRTNASADNNPSDDLKVGVPERAAMAVTSRQAQYVTSRFGQCRGGQWKRPWRSAETLVGQVCEQETTTENKAA